MANPDGLETWETHEILGDGAKHVNRAAIIFGACAAKVQKIGERRLSIYRPKSMCFDNKWLYLLLRFA
jgi:hypothetical protein